MPKTTRRMFAFCILCPSLAVAQHPYNQPITPNYGRFLQSTSWLPTDLSRVARTDVSESLPDPYSTNGAVGSGARAQPQVGEASGSSSDAARYSSDASGYGSGSSYDSGASSAPASAYGPDTGHGSETENGLGATGYGSEAGYGPTSTYGYDSAHGYDTGYEFEYGLEPGYGSDIEYSHGVGYSFSGESGSAVGSGVEQREAMGQDVDLGEPMTIPQQGSVELQAPQARGSCTGCQTSGCDGACSSLIRDTGHRCGGWFGGLYYLGLWRDDDSRGNVLGVDSLDPATPLLTTGSARMEEAHGFAVRIGKMLNQCTALEGVYWQVFPDDTIGQLPTSSTPGLVNSSLAFTGLDYDNGGGVQPVDNFYQGTSLLEARRSYDYRNLELNLLKMPFVYGGPRSRARVALLAGVRYFRGDESFGLATDLLNETFGDDPNNELIYQSDVENHLVGFQLGALLDYQIVSRLSGMLNSKVGVYNNHMRMEQVVGGGTGAALVSAGPFTGQPFAVSASKDDVALLAELDAGLAYSVERWRLSLGYRVLAVSGFAQAVSQIPYDFSDLASAAYIQDHDTLLLHGAYGGVEFTW